MGVKVAYSALTGDVSKFAEWDAILRYVAHKWGKHLLGSTPEEMGRIEQIANYVHDLKMKSTSHATEQTTKQPLLRSAAPFSNKSQTTLEDLHIWQAVFLG